VSRYKFYNEQVISQVIVIFLTIPERSAYDPGRVLSSYRCFSKNHDELINFTGVVSKSELLIVQELSWGQDHFFLSPGTEILTLGPFEYNLSDRQDLSA